MSAEQNVIGLVFQVSTALAGILLVFIGFLFARAEAAQTKRGDAFRHVARAGIIPFGLCLLSAWFCLDFLQGSAIAHDPAILLFRTGLIVTAWYAFVVLFMYL